MEWCQELGLNRRIALWIDAEELSQALSHALSQGGAKSKYSKEDRRRNQLWPDDC